MKNLDNPPLSINLRRYFVADCDVNGEVVNDSIHEINLEEALAEAKEQIQEDLMSYFDGPNDEKIIDMDEVCQIVVDNFKGLEIE